MTCTRFLHDTLANIEISSQDGQMLDIQILGSKPEFDCAPLSGNVEFKLYQ